jgi:1-acyl-sn-glycerol-3-phosphate acyltransferase
MNELELKDNCYTTKIRKLSLLAQFLPSLHFYSRLAGIVFRASLIAKRGEYNADRWADSSHAVLDCLEDIGVHIQVTGLDNIRNLKEPSVIIGNHMSFLETLLLPIMILPQPVAFVVKQSLLEYPVFKHVVGARYPIAVSRTNPRQDLKTVLDEGENRLREGMSVIVFPQSTRSHVFEPDKMSSIGVKLAKKADVPVIPMALKTDALQNGTLLKDFGKIDRNLPVRFAFDSPLRVNGKGNDEQDAINTFIEHNLSLWAAEIKAG